MNKTYDNYEYNSYSSVGRSKNINSTDRKNRYKDFKDESTEKREETSTSYANVVNKNQRKTNDLIQNGNPNVSQAKSQDLSYSGTYTVVSNALNMRYAPGLTKENNIVRVLHKDDKIENYGYFTKIDGKVWLLVRHNDKTGYVMLDFIKK